MKKILTALLILLGSACAHRIAPPAQVVDNRLPKWDAATMSDGCSTVFELAHSRFADIEIKVNGLEFSSAETACCEVHDHRYYDGGSEADRLRADDELYQCFLGSVSRVNIVGRITERIKADLVYQAVRDRGGPEGRINGVSWDNGPRNDPQFEYTAVPRQERDR